MATREELVEHLWKKIINPLDDPSILENIIANCRRQPDAIFAQVGPAIERALAAGVPAADICLIYRGATYEAVFGPCMPLVIPGWTAMKSSGCMRTLPPHRVPSGDLTIQSSRSRFAARLDPDVSCQKGGQ